MRLHPTHAIVLAATLLLLAVMPGAADAQCIVANPSFEVPGQGGAVFGGWNQFGDVGESGDASHGARAPRVRGPAGGAWEVSGYWQRQDSAPGEQWRVTGHVRNPSSRPLTGQCVALVNVEWRDAAGDLIDYASFTVADAGTPTDTWTAFTVTAAPAPAGAAAVHLLLGVLQAPGDPVAAVDFDQVTFREQTPPTIDDLQWDDFPGGTTLAFAGRTWRVKGPGYYGPGPNVFSDDPDCVWVDADQRLHLTLQDRGGVWTSTEVVLEEALGYGDYVITTEGRLDLLDPDAVLGLFLWQYGPCWDEGYLWWNPYNEIDIEYSRWTNPFNDLVQFVAQPYDFPGNIERFDMAFAAGEVVSHAMRWLPDRVEYRVWRGGPHDESAATLVHAWTYTGPHVSRPEQPRLHLNLWKVGEAPASDQEVVFTDFTFVPEGAVGVADEHDLAAAPAGRLLAPAPNPFNPRTTLRYALARDGDVALTIHDATGRRVRSLVDGRRPAGEHRAVWRGLDDTGRRLASGVYLVRLRGEGFVESRRVTLLK
jgi:hypothetical protein